MPLFLPTTMEDLKKRKIEVLDFIFISGDAYVDHSSFGNVVIARLVESLGYTVGFIAQPNHRSLDDFKKLGRPKYGFLVSAGNMDSMVNHFSVGKIRRRDDVFSPGGRMGKRPDRATIVYCNKIREAFGDIPIVIGGLEASLRRFAHYDYWDDKVRHSILEDSGADLLSFGMGERSITEIVSYLSSGILPKDIQHIDGTCYMTADISHLKEDEILMIPSFEEVSKDKKTYAKTFAKIYLEQNPMSGKTIVQKQGKRYLVQNKPSLPLTQQELDDVYRLPFSGKAHPTYNGDGIPALSEVAFSITLSSGCFGGCNFCAIQFHEGRMVISRREDSILEEAIKLTEHKDFKGYIHDVGGPTANFSSPACKKQQQEGPCPHKRCLGKSPCKNIDVDHTPYLKVLRKLRSLPKVKKVFIRSGIRYDYALMDQDPSFIRELAEHHVSGQLRVAPEHIDDATLSLMNKPGKKIYEDFLKVFNKESKKVGKEQYVVPYWMSSHPGCTLESAIRLAEYLNEQKQQPEQVQDFYPTPGTLSTAMYYTGYHPLTMEKVYVAKSPRDKAMQRALLQFKKPKTYDLVKEALLKAGRRDLIGYDEKCLIPPRPKEEKNEKQNPKKESGKKPNKKEAPKKYKSKPQRGQQKEKPNGKQSTGHRQR